MRNKTNAIVGCILLVHASECLDSTQCYFLFMFLFDWLNVCILVEAPGSEKVRRLGQILKFV